MRLALSKIGLDSHAYDTLFRTKAGLLFRDEELNRGGHLVNSVIPGEQLVSLIHKVAKFVQ